MIYVVTSLPSNASIIVDSIKILECTARDADSILDLYALYSTLLATVFPLIVLSCFSFINDNTLNARFFCLSVSHLALIG